MLKLKLLMRRTDPLEKTLMLGKIEGGGEGDDRGCNGWMDSMDMSLSELRKLVMDRGLACGSSWGHKESDTTERLK